LIAEKTWCAGDDAPALLVDVIHDGLPSFDLVVRPRHSVEGFRHRAGSVMRSPAPVLDP
jgi:hypothetical protein